MKVSVFSSGSSGNATLISTKNTNILIDIGLTKKNIVENLFESGLLLSDIDAILITHEHTDHIKALPQMLREDIIIYMTFGTLEAIKKIYSKIKYPKVYELIEKRINDNTIKIMEKGNFIYNSFDIYDLKITPIPLFHDVIEPVGFILNEENKKLVYITDTGYVHTDLFPYIENANMYILESNHEPSILMMSNRPYPTKIRILSDHGHMSNEESMITLTNIIGPNTKYCLHAHVSKECNLSEIIEMTRKRVFEKYNMNVDNIEFFILHDYREKDFEI